MNKAVVFHYISKVLLVSSAILLLPCAVSIYYKEHDSAITFLIIALCVAIVSTPLAVIKPKNTQMFAKEGLVIAAMLWILIPIIGALPFYVSGEIKSFCDALFESVSGFTTTGSTVISNVEAMSKGMLFWRSLTHWVGGMGVLVLAVAILPSSADALHLMRGECAGPQVGKIVPKGKLSAAYLYIIYAFITLLTFIFLYLGGMPLFDSVCHAMGAAGTGGFSVKNTGISYYNSPYIEAVIAVSVTLCGINFSLFYFLLVKRFKEVFKNTELKVYFGLIIAATAAVMLNTLSFYGNASKAFRYSSFTVISIITSAGFGCADFNKWPMFSKMIILLLMFAGSCAGSTGGGFKLQRVIIMYKSSVKYLRKMLHPKSVNIVKSDDKTMDTETVHGVHNYFIIYMAIFAFSLLLVSLNNEDFTTTFTAVAACFNNIGPGLEKVGPVSNYAFLSDFSKYVLSADMLLGRLESLPLIILLSPSVWRKNF